MTDILLLPEGGVLDQLVIEARSIAQAFNQPRVAPEHAIFALLAGGLCLDMGSLGVDRDQLMMTLEAGFGYTSRQGPGNSPPATIVSESVTQALESSRGNPGLALRHLLRACPSPDHGAPAPIPEPLPDIDELLDAIEREKAGLGFDRICKDVFQRQGDASHLMPKGSGMIPGLSDGNVKPEDDAVGASSHAPEKLSLSAKERLEAKRAVERSIRDLTQLFRAGALDPVVGRDQEIDLVCQVLMRRRKSNVLLVGDPGVGKTALMEGVAARMATSPDRSLSRRPVLQASLGALVAGARYRGDFEIRMEILVEHALERHAVLFFDEMQMLVGSGVTAERGMDGANLLKPVLARDGMSLVGATTHEEAAVIRADPALMRRFEVVVVTEPDTEMMRDILPEAAGPYLLHHDIKADRRILENIIDFSDLYLPARSFPDKAFDLLDMSCVQARLSGRKKIRMDDVRAAVRRLGGTLPAPRPACNGSLRNKIIARISDHVGGHPEAILRLADIVMEAGCSRPAFIHLDGPAGVGRRTLARALARAMRIPIVEFDSSLGPDRLLEALQAGLRPGSRAVVLVTAMDPIRQEMRDVLKKAATLGYFHHSKRAVIDLRGVIFIFKGKFGQNRIGFSSGFSENSLDIHGLEVVSMGSFEGDSLKDAVDFELKRIARAHSDSGETLKITDCKSILYRIPSRISSWPDIVRFTRDALTLEE